ncbi:MAG: hypothetical protein IJE57_01720 [Anaerotignum sp.]|nr:hypothetical protein [Anaerotignum sp.]MBQ7102957.1 hypothetical protein [Anaerotignum sp.]
MSREQRQFIQCVAALTMLIDHIGVVFFPTVIGFRAIGRLSFPLFAFGIAQGVRYTSDFRKYFNRILLAAVVSQPIYMKLFGLSQLNPLFMLAWGAGALYFWQKGKTGLAGVFLIGSYFMDMSYGWYGVWTIFFFGFYGMKDSLCFYGQVILNVLYGLTTGAWVQVLSLFSFMFLDGKWRIEALSKKLPRYFFYVFYPLHLLVLWGIGIVL